MWQWIHKAASPKITYRWAEICQSWLALLSLICFSYGAIGALLLSPIDYQQGNVYRIMYLHVPSAIWSLGVYMIMAIAVVIYFVWKIKVADVVAQTSAPIGASFALLTLITGSIWGKPTWGTFWIWDARLTSELILLFIYIGIIAIRSAIPDRNLAARASGVVTLMGVVNIPIVHYSVNWWNTLHQGATLLKLGAPSIAPSMLHPLLAMISAFFFYYFWLLMAKVRTELLIRESHTQWVKSILCKEEQH
mgnify:CR=1 FL=1